MQYLVGDITNADAHQMRAEKYIFLWHRLSDVKYIFNTSMDKKKKYRRKVAVSGSVGDTEGWGRGETELDPVQADGISKE